MVSDPVLFAMVCRCGARPFGADQAAAGGARADAAAERAPARPQGPARDTARGVCGRPGLGLRPHRAPCQESAVRVHHGAGKRQREAETRGLSFFT